MEYLSIADGHTKYCDCIYNTFVLKGKTVITKEELFNASKLNEVLKW